MELSKQSIFAAFDIKVEPVEVPEWGGTLYVRTFSGKQRDAIDKFIASACDAQGKLRDPSGLRVQVVLASACNSKGELLFVPEDAASLGDKSAAAIERIFNAAQALNGMGDSPEEAKKN